MALSTAAAAAAYSSSREYRTRRAALRASRTMLALGYFRSLGPDETVEQLEQSFEQYCESYLHQAMRVFIEANEAPPYAAYAGMIVHMAASRSDFLIVVPNSGHLGDDLESVVRSVLNSKGPEPRWSVATRTFQTRSRTPCLTSESRTFRDNVATG